MINILNKIKCFLGNQKVKNLVHSVQNDFDYYNYGFRKILSFRVLEELLNQISSS